MDDLVEVLEWTLVELNKKIKAYEESLMVYTRQADDKSLWGLQCRAICGELNKKLEELQKLRETVRGAIRHEGESD